MENVRRKNAAGPSAWLAPRSVAAPIVVGGYSAAAAKAASFWRRRRRAGTAQAMLHRVLPCPDV